MNWRCTECNPRCDLQARCSSIPTACPFDADGESSATWRQVVQVSAKKKADAPRRKHVQKSERPADGIRDLLL